MGYVFQDEWWEKHPNGCSFRLLWLKEIGKEMEKALKRKSGINQHVIYENNGNQEKTKMKSHKLHVRRRLKENNGKLNKLEASLIKRILRIYW